MEEDVAALDDYAAAWEEWESTGERQAWEVTTADGLADACGEVSLVGRDSDRCCPAGDLLDQLTGRR